MKWPFKKQFAGLTLLLVCFHLSFSQESKSKPADRPKATGNILISGDSLIVKNKVKVITEFSYWTNDSSFEKTPVHYKSTNHYNKQGLLLSTNSEDGKGNFEGQILYSYDSKNNLTGSITYNSYHVKSDSSVYQYDAQNRTLRTASYKLGQSSRSLLNSTQYSYEANGYNKLSIDSSGAYPAKAISKYDSSGNVLLSEQYYHEDLNQVKVFEYNTRGQLIHSELEEQGLVDDLDSFMVYAPGKLHYKAHFHWGHLKYSTNYTYDPEGAYTAVCEWFETSGIGQPSKGLKGRGISQFDKKDKQLFTQRTVIDADRQFTTDKTWATYTYEKDKLLYSKSVAVSYFSNSGTNTADSAVTTNEERHKFDRSGNRIETIYMYDGHSPEQSLSNINEILRYKYNFMNSLLEESNYPLNGKGQPEGVSTYSYYSDGVTLKERRSNYHRRSGALDRYNEKGLIIETIQRSDYGNQREVLQYEYW